MALDPNIILSGVGPDVVGSMSRGNALAGEILGQRRSVALNNLYQTQGADILAGKQPALNALAGLDPVSALGVHQTQQQIGFTAEEMEMKRAEIARLTSERAASLSADEAAKHAAQIERGVAAATAATSPQQWDQIVTQFGAQDLVGQFGNKDAIINSYLGVAEGLKRVTPTVPEVSIPSGYIPVDPNNPRAGVQLLPGYTPKSGPDVVVNMGDGAPGLGKLSSDYGYVLDPNTGKPVIDPTTGLPKAAPIPGSPAAQEAAGSAGKARLSAGNAQIASETITTAATRAIDAAGQRAFGEYGQGLVEMIPQSDAAEVRRQVGVLKSQAIVSNLQAMRDASPTGGALGAVTAPELELLANKAGALDPSSPTFQRDIEDYTKTLLKIVHGPEQGAVVFDQWKGGTTPPKGIVIDGFQIEEVK